MRSWLELDTHGGSLPGKYGSGVYSPTTQGRKVAAPQSCFVHLLESVVALSSK